MTLPKFRLRQARQRGEAVAKEFGFFSLPVDPFKIAEASDILVQGNDAGQPGMSGCIIFQGDSVGIIYSTHIRSEGFRRFTVAHELGHYFLEGHPEEIQKSSGTHVSRAGFTEGSSSIELEADHFASGLLMPTSHVREVLLRSPVGLVGIEALAKEAKASLTAAAIRAAECAPYPMAVIVSRGAEISYSFMPDSFKALPGVHYLRKGTSLPDTATRAFNVGSGNIAQGRRHCASVSLRHWFEGAASRDLDEEIVGLGSYGLTLTVLSSDQLQDDPDEVDDEEESLMESWEVRFR